MSRRHVAIETWDPDYGAPTEPGVLEPSDVSVNADVEMDAADWRPLAPPSGGAVPEDVLFIDGVRRTDAYAWVTEGDEPPFRAILATYGAGAALTGRDASFSAPQIERVLVADRETEPLATRAGTYEPVIAAGSSPEELSQALQVRLTNLEIRIAEQCEKEAELIIVDGPLRGRQDTSGIGYIKSHRVSYLPEPLQPTIAGLQSGQRTPLFFLTTSWSRYAWYLRLPGPATHAWWGVVRCEASESLRVQNASAVADQVTAVLPKFASPPHKDPRAPQNLYPIGRLEEHLRRLMGDARLVQRYLREVK